MSLLLQQLFTQCCLFHGHLDMLRELCCATELCLLEAITRINGERLWEEWEGNLGQLGTFWGGCLPSRTLRSCAAPSHLIGIASVPYKEQKD